MLGGSRTSSDPQRSQCAFKLVNVDGLLGNKTVESHSTKLRDSDDGEV